MRVSLLLDNGKVTSQPRQGDSRLQRTRSGPMVGKVETRREAVTLYARAAKPVNYSLAVRRLAEATVRRGDPRRTLGLTSVCGG